MLHVTFAQLSMLWVILTFTNCFIDVESEVDNPTETPEIASSLLDGDDSVLVDSETTAKTETAGAEAVTEGKS